MKSAKSVWPFFLALSVLVVVFKLSSQIWFNRIASNQQVESALERESKEVDARNSQGYTGLIVAVMNAKPDQVDLFLKYGADPNMKTPEKKETIPFERGGNTALHWALWVAGNLHWERVLDSLLAAKASPNIANVAGDTAFHLIFRVGDPKKQIEILKKLVAHGGNINAQNEAGDTIVHVMVNNVMQPLLREVTQDTELVKKIDFNIKNKEGRTALESAEHHGWSDLVDLLKPVTRKN